MGACLFLSLLRVRQRQQRVGGDAAECPSLLPAGYCFRYCCLPVPGQGVSSQPLPRPIAVMAVPEKMWDWAMGLLACSVS